MICYLGVNVKPIVQVFYPQYSVSVGVKSILSISIKSKPPFCGNYLVICAVKERHAKFFFHAFYPLADPRLGEIH